MRVAVASASQYLSDGLRKLLADDARHQLAWTAYSREEVMQRCARDTPDLLLLDVALHGVETTQQIMRSAPCAIVLLTTSVIVDGGRVFQAMGEGALDVVEVAGKAPLTRANETALLSKIDTVRKLLGDQRGRPSLTALNHDDGLLAIGASAGGPAALAKLLSGLPVTFPFAVVIVQHVDAYFAREMASWLSQQSAWQVRIAVEGDRPTPGVALLAGELNHLVFKSPERVGYTVEPADYPYRPSIDSFFFSINRHWRGEVIGVLLTGMGRDGSLGLKALRDSHHHTIAQDEQSSAVYGMPKAAARIDAAAEILSLTDIAPRLQALTASRRLHLRGRHD